MVQIFIAAAGAILGTAAGTIGATAILGTTIATVAGYAAYTAVTAYAINALQKKSLAKARSAAASVAAAQKGYGTNVNAVAPASDHAIIYGEQRVGGVVFYRSITDDQKFLHTLIALAGHECNAIGTVFADNVALTLDGNGFVTNDAFQIKDADGAVVNSALRINKHLGDNNQAADADLVAEDSAWTTAHQAKNIAYIYIRAEFDTSVFPQGLPVFSAIVQGRKINDPRNTNQAEFTSNAALCLMDYLESDFGLGVDGTEINRTIFAAAANVCDENVALSAGGTEKRYTVNG